MKGRIIVLLLSVLACLSCRDGSNKTSGFVFPEADTIPLSEAEKLSPEAIADIQKNLASPVEIANLLQTLEVPFSGQYLANSINAGRQSTSFDKAIKLGILGADLGYLNMYEKTGNSLDLLSSIRQLSEDIRVGQFFNFDAIKKLSQNKTNLDSLLLISIDSYSKIDDYLRANDRGQLSALMVIGVWIEGQYLATQVVKQYPNEILRDRIAEQKIILNDLILLLKPYCDRDNEFNALCLDMEKIREKYRQVKITFSQGNPLTVEKDGRLEIEQTERSKVEMTDSQLAAIISVTSDLRNRLILND